jgi:hypothetical protein
MIPSLSHLYSTVALQGIFHCFGLRLFFSEFCVLFAFGYSCLASLFPDAFTRDVVHDMFWYLQSYQFLVLPFWAWRELCSWSEFSYRAELFVITHTLSGVYYYYYYYYHHYCYYHHHYCYYHYHHLTIRFFFWPLLWLLIMNFECCFDLPGFP